MSQHWNSRFDRIASLRAARPGFQTAELDITGIPVVSDQQSLPIELSRTDESHLLNTGWPHVQSLWPILGVGEFQAYYDSLWTPRRKVRQSSALVDSLLAICMQVTSTAVSNNGSGRSNVLIAGQQLYNRTRQLLLEEEQAAPTLATVQTFIFSSIYLLYTDRIEPAYATIDGAVRLAYGLDLHHDPPEGMDARQREVRRRVWWALYTMESYLTTSMGLPSLIVQGEVSCGWPTISPMGGSSSNHFQVHWAKLLMSIQIVRTVFDQQQKEILRETYETDLSNLPGLLESIAMFMVRPLKAIREGLKAVPSPLRIPRKDGSRGFSFLLKGATVSLDGKAPLWLQRQQYALEISYHSLSLAVLRPFLYLQGGDSASMPRAHAHAVTGVKHAVTLTVICHQCLTESESLARSLPMFRCQWDSCLYLITFILANPKCTFAAEAQKAVDTAEVAFAILVNSLGLSCRASEIMDDLRRRAEEMVHPPARMVSPSQPSSCIDSAAASSPGSHVSSGVISDHGHLGAFEGSQIPPTVDPSIGSDVGSLEFFTAAESELSMESALDVSSLALEAPSWTDHSMLDVDMSWVGDNVLVEPWQSNMDHVFR
ncbi:hypothetical protein AtubIFM55763_011697 [Aspergillus tubingensis]|uniref:Xylanolytic transcriptional activator regulatory domain-containing protein n=1 Tax=Aspergillus tubingensis TaxID=5068 RepID=A0A9W6AT20_ASPTU|nr:hypothetical protein AtubIFM54640_006247 [Aspergillus tubingensis]GLA78683.1 hypothetical protein AtubIFM55763_011697 [Aspergillus tubingensis]GLA86209.1 hypothetical protein AtubIFM56815_010465 [Aspergillus tubingensis]